VADAKNWPAIGDRSFSGYEKNRFWRHDGGYSFSERAREYGLDSTRDGRGVVCFDYDNDGDEDLFVANQDAPPHLYRNDLKTTNHWLGLRLVSDPATKINRDALGARITLITSGDRQIRDHNGGKCYCGQSDPRPHFGLGRDERVKLLEVRWPDGGLQYVENVPADQYLTIRQAPEQYATQLATSQPVPKAWQRPKTPAEPAVPKLSAEELEKLLSETEAALRKSLASYKLASSYRSRCAAYEQHDRAIKFFQSLLAKTPGSQRARLELASALVDKIPTCGGMAAIVSKGTLARKSLDQLDAYLAAEPDSWIGRYTRGMNHLHWPRALMHSADAAKDFVRCIELQEKGGKSKAKPYHLRAHIALGDAYAKNRQVDKARPAWQQGLKAFPDSQELKDRLAIKDGAQLLKFVEGKRSLDHPIDTDLSFMDRE
jgi:tetratricopeptide (TPR) repeat protein